VRFRGAGEGRVATSLHAVQAPMQPTGPTGINETAHRLGGPAAADVQPVASDHRDSNETVALHPLPTAGRAPPPASRRAARGLREAHSASTGGSTGGAMHADGSGWGAALLARSGGRALQQAAGSGWQAEAAAFGGQLAVNQYGAAWAVNNAPPFPIDLFIATDEGTVGTCVLFMLSQFEQVVILS
jgi:hypothetical protein